MLSAAVVCLVLTAGPTSIDESVAADLTPKQVKATASAVNFDALPPVVNTPDDVRVKRFLGAFAGGVVGLGAALALMPLGDSVGCFGGPCVSFLHGLIGTFAPLLALGGAWLGYELTGGDGGLLTPAIALAPALLIALGLLNLAAEMDSNSTLSLMPYVITSGVFLAGGAALAFDVRARQLSALGGAASWGKASAGRVGVTALVTALAGASTAALSALLGAAAGFYNGVGPVVLVGLSAALGSIGVAAAGWGVHRAMNGRGSFLSALTGLGLGWLVTGAGVALFALAQAGSFATFNPVRSTSGALLMSELAIAAAILGPTLALEWSHTDAVQASLPTFSIGAAPIAQGGMLSAGLRF